MEIADLVALSERLGAPVSGPELARRALIATRFGAASPSEARRTRLGGAPELPPGTAWPRDRGEAMTFVAQIDLASLPERRDRVLSGEGVLSLFCVRDPDSGEAGGAWVAHNRSSDLTPIEYPPDLDDTARLPEVPLYGVPELTIPDQQAQELAEVGLDPYAYDEAAERHGQLVEEAAAVQDLRLNAHRLLGHPTIFEHDPLGDVATLAAHELRDPALGDAPWRLLLQVDGAEDALEPAFGASEVLYFALPEGDLRAGRFDRTSAITHWT